MSKFTFLDYFNNYSYDNLMIVERAAQFKSRDALAAYLGFSSDTIKSWFRLNEAYRKTPTPQNWNYILFQLEAKRLGYDGLYSLFQKNFVDEKFCLPKKRT